ncbi:SusD family protein [Bacteroidales bacterium Barb6XT]|nr:SusD family protein [Bacteroidales bacterium Barb6XT]
MKKLAYTVLAAALVFSSCTNLESEMYDVINPGIFPKNEKDVEAIVTSAAYAPFRSSGYSGIFTVASGGIQIITEMSTDLGECQWNDAVWPDVLYQNFTPNSTGVIKFYRDHLRDISKMTLALDRIAPVDVQESAKARLAAELHCGRGWLAYLLYDLYGPVPVATLQQLLNPGQEELLERPTKEWMVSYIETELQEAVKGLPANYKSSDANYGRFTGGLAYTVLMKLYMHEGNWAEAEKCARELAKPEYGYALVPEYKDIFTLENEKNAEIIWAAQCSRGVNQQLWLAHVLPSQYPTKNPNIQKWSGYRVPWAFYNTFDPKDKRLETLVGDFAGTDGETYNEQNKGVVLAKGALPVKYGEDPVATGEESQVDWIVYRYADILTSLSEIIVRRNNAVTQEAVDLLNTVRDRAGITPYTLSSFANTEDFLDKVLLNRGQEFWFEGLRRTDLIRHGKYIEYARTCKGSVTTKDEFVLMPLPQAAINEGKGIVIQNPGY